MVVGAVLDRLIGESAPPNPLNPADDRAVDLAQHLDPDGTMGNDMRVAVRCVDLN